MNDVAGKIMLAVGAALLAGICALVWVAIVGCLLRLWEISITFTVLKHRQSPDDPGANRQTADRFGHRRR